MRELVRFDRLSEGVDANILHPGAQAIVDMLGYAPIIAFCAAVIVVWIVIGVAVGRYSARTGLKVVPALVFAGFAAGMGLPALTLVVATIALTLNACTSTARPCHPVSTGLGDLLLLSTYLLGTGKGLVVFVIIGTGVGAAAGVVARRRAIRRPALVQGDGGIAYQD